MAEIVNATDESFAAEVLSTNGPVLLDVWAEWCGPCKAMGPALESVAQEFDGQVKVVKLDMDEYEDLVEDLGVRSLPTLIFYKNGDRVADRSGAATEEEIASFVKEHLA